MKTTVKVSKEIEVRFVDVRVPMHDDEIEEAQAKAWPFVDQQKKEWSARIDVDTGQIQNWPESAGTCHIYLFPRDGGEFVLVGPDGKEIARREDYVPTGLIPSDSGDDMDLEIDHRGRITNWPKRPLLGQFFPGSDDE